VRDRIFGVGLGIVVVFSRFGYAEEGEVLPEPPPSAEETVWPGIPFSLETRWRYRDVSPAGSTYRAAPPELRHRGYLYQRARFRRGSLEAGWMAKRPSPGPALTFQDLERRGTVKAAAQWRRKGAWEGFTLGNYALSAGQGLFFYDGLGEWVRPVMARPRSHHPDYSTGNNVYFKGAATSWRWGDSRLHLWASRQARDYHRDPATGRVDQDLSALRADAGDIQDDGALNDNNTVLETLAGARWEYGGSGGRWGLTGFGERWNAVFDPVSAGMAAPPLFHGDRLVGSAVDGEISVGPMTLFGEAARSRAGGGGFSARTGGAWTAGSLTRSRGRRLWVLLFDYDPDFVSPHGQGPAYAVVDIPDGLPRNQRGARMGAEISAGRWTHRGEWVGASFPGPQGSGTGNSTAPRGAGEARRVYWESAWEVDSDWVLLCRVSHADELRAGSVAEGRAVGTRRVDRLRVESVWEPLRGVKWRLRTESRRERGPGPEDASFGNLAMTELVWRAGKWGLGGRVYVFDSPAADLTTGAEEIWDGVPYTRLAGGLGDLRGSPGTRQVVTARYGGRRAEVWVKYDVNQRRIPPGATPSIGERRRHGLHVQVDWRWGKGKL
jgi:hypothetical protein